MTSSIDNAEIARAPPSTKTNQKSSQEMDRIFYHYIFGGTLAYLLVGLSLWSTSFFVLKIKEFKCHGDEEKENTLTQPKCDELFKSALGPIHSVTFGLMSAVALCHLGNQDSQESGRGSYGKLEKFMEEYKIKYENISIQDRRGGTMSSMSHCIGSMRRSICTIQYKLIVWSSRVCVIAWMINGVLCLAFGTLWGPLESGPLYVTGQSWLGIAVSTTFNFFGVNEKDKINNDDVAFGANTNQMGEAATPVTNAATSHVVDPLTNDKTESGHEGGPIVEPSGIDIAWAGE
ncbi:hypothetical protein ACHAXS_007400 [Conticribra weissflogii]